MKINFLVILMVILWHGDVLLTLNIDLTDLEENLIYSHLKNETNLKLFYDKLIESNGVDDSRDVRQRITNEDIERGTIENKVILS